MLTKKRVCFLLIAFVFSLLPNTGFAKTTTPGSEYIGYHDTTSCEAIKGWAREVNPQTMDNEEEPQEPLTVEFYLDYPFDNPMTIKLGEVLADQVRADLPFKDKNHGFSFVVPENAKDQFHWIYSAIKTDKDHRASLKRTGQSIYCGPEKIVHNIGDWIEVVEEGFKPRTRPGEEHPIAWRNKFWARSYYGGYTDGLLIGMAFGIVGVKPDKEGNMWYEVNPGVYPEKELRTPVLKTKWFIPADPRKVKKIPTFIEELARAYDHIPGEFSIDLDISKREIAVKKGIFTIIEGSCVNIGKGEPGGVLGTPVGRYKLVSAWRLMNRYMKGSDYDLPGVAFVQYLVLVDEQGNVIIVKFDIQRLSQAFHEASWWPNSETDYCQRKSHGCINTMKGIGRWMYYTFHDREVFVYIFRNEKEKERLHNLTKEEESLALNEK